MRTPARLPLPLSQRLSGATAALLTRQGREVDVAIAGIPFRLATTNDIPQSVETIPAHKDQLDVESDPGEQSLSNWWRRSQDSWHEGAGNLYQEARADLTTSLYKVSLPSSGYYDSSGVDVWTKGKMSLLRQMNVMDNTTAFSRIKVSSSTISAVSSASLWTSTSPTVAFSALHTPAGKTLVDGFVAGSNFYDVANDGTLYAGTVASPGTATTWPCGTTPSRLAFGKGRLWMIGGPKIWQPNLSLAGGSAQNPVFTNPNAGWTYTCMAEGPAAMYFGGHDGNTSSIQAITLDSSGGLPTLSGATVSIVLPDGELVQEIAVLAGQFIGIGTSRGFRVGTISGTNIVYGPLLFTPPGVTACTAITTMDRFFLVAFNTASEGAVAYRVDTSVQIADGVFPYAKDVSCLGTGYISSLAVYSGSPTRVLATSGAGVAYSQDSSVLVASGWLQTGRIRFRTTEKKIFKYFDLETEPLRGQIVVNGIEETGTNFDITTFSVQGEVLSESTAITSVLGPQRQIALKFTLTRDPSTTSLGPVINSYLVRAFPAVKPQRLYTLPLLCYDQELSKSGSRYGYEGYSADRLAALQYAEDSADTVTFQDFTRKTPGGETVLIENLKFVQTSAGSPRLNAYGQGGILLIQLRTVSA